MASTNFNTNNVDLDTIYLPRVSTPTSNVNYLVSGVDISNNYEPYVAGSTKAPSVFYNKTDIDLSNIFASKNFRQLSYEYYTVAETASQYKTNDDGQVVVTVINADLNSPGPTHNYTVTLKNSSGAVVNSITQGWSGDFSAPFSFTGLNQGDYYITVRDNYSPNGLIDSNRQLTVGYNTGTSPTTTIEFTN